jgi:hypothetical protein
MTRRRLLLPLLCAALLAAAAPALGAGAGFHGSTGGIRLARPIVAMASTPTGKGYWLVASDGGMFAFGDARFHGSTGGRRLAGPIVAMVRSRTGRGYWLAGADGAVYAFGDARHRGSAAGAPLARQIVGMASTPTGRGYWLVASDGGVFAFGDARHRGSTGGVRLARPIVGMASTPTGGGYWLVASDGGMFAFGDARFRGSTGGMRLTRPVVGMAATPIGDGYWLVASDGGIFAFPSRRSSSRSPQVGGCPVLPADNPWNRDVSKLPVHPKSAQWIADIDGGSNHFLHADFGENQSYGIPYSVVPSTQPRVPITFTAYGDESDPGPYPVPPGARVEAGSDRHVLVVQRGTCKLYELFAAERSGGGWDAASGAVFDLRSNRLRPEGWTSADAAGLPIFPGLVRYDEVAAGRIAHALRFTVRRSQRGYVHPATHFAGSTATAPPMGARLRLKAGYDLSRFGGQARVVLQALKRYGMLVADNGTSWYLTGAPSPGWDDDDLDQLKTVPGSAFEVVNTGPIHD